MKTMANISTGHFSDIFTTRKDPAVDTWPLMGSHGPIAGIVIGYLAMVYLGPIWMSTRKPYALKLPLVVYNTSQVLFNAWICFVCVGFRVDYMYEVMTNGCTTTMSPEFLRDLSIGAWWYFVAKAVDILDTFFFILRKKDNQITGLHVYHHASTVLYAWLYLKHIPAQQGIVLGCLNSMIHVAMYTYYLLSSFGDRFQKYLWWKKYMTQMQLIQFTIMFVYLCLLTFWDCKPPKGLTLLFALNVGTFIILFSNFYRRSYKKPGPVCLSKSQ